MLSKTSTFAKKSRLLNRGLIFLHGFLGSPEDWKGVVEYLPDFECRLLEYPFKIPEEGIVIGYSMGGRIALAASNPKVLLSVHPGLQNEEEKRVRWEQDQRWAARFTNEPLEEVLKDWYRQPLFETLDISSILERRLQQKGVHLAEILGRESLAHQIFHIPKDAIFLHGEYDLKFKELYRSLHLPSIEIPQVGHAAHLEHPRACAEAITLAISRLVSGVPHRE
jgi:2-succinyl-6-hydroxy-2,4-cyclohexadiene-1-carboxylate synthase